MDVSTTEVSLLSCLRWRCRRGVKELDILLSRYLEVVYPVTSLAQRQAFEALLGLSDPMILGLILGTERPPDQQIADVIQQLTNPTK